MRKIHNQYQSPEKGSDFNLRKAQNRNSNLVVNKTKSETIHFGTTVQANSRPCFGIKAYLARDILQKSIIFGTEKSYNVCPEKFARIQLDPLWVEDCSIKGDSFHIVHKIMGTMKDRRYFASVDSKFGSDFVRMLIH